MADELARLGLVNTSVRLITGVIVWDEIARLVKQRSGLVAAIAEIGAAGAGHLSIGRGATVITNAGIDAIRAGRTDPGVLLSWVEAGASVYSMESLHAMLILADGDPAFVLVGSGGSARSTAGPADDAVVISDDSDTVREGRRILSEWRQRAGSPLTVPMLRDRLGDFGTDGHSRAGRADSAPAVAAPSSNGVAPSSAAAPAAPSRAAEPPKTVTVLPPRVPGPPARTFPGASDAPAGPRPRTLTVTGIFRRGQASAEAESRLAALKADHEREDNIGVVEMFWWDLAPGSSDVRLYRDGEYVVGVDLGETGRRQKRCPLWPPGRVLHTYTDGAAWPVRVYCYLLVAGSGEAPTLGDLQAGVLTIGEKLEFDRGYMRAAVIEKILGLWPDVSYVDN